MKKIFVLLLVLLLFSGCSKNDYSKLYDLETYNCDMSSYEGLENVEHVFVGTTVSELKRLIDEKGYGVFAFSSKYCSHCQIAMQYLNEVAKELNVTMFYIDGTSQEYPIQNTDNYDILFDILYDTLNEGPDGKEIQTPEIFSVIDGEIKDYQVGTTWNGLEYDDKDIDNLKDVYRRILTPFVKQSQD